MLFFKIFFDYLTVVLSYDFWIILYDSSTNNKWGVTAIPRAGHSRNIYPNTQELYPIIILWYSLI